MNRRDFFLGILAVGGAVLAPLGGLTAQEGDGRGQPNQPCQPQGGRRGEGGVPAKVDAVPVKAVRVAAGCRPVRNL